MNHKNDYTKLLLFFANGGGGTVHSVRRRPWVSSGHTLVFFFMLWNCEEIFFGWIHLCASCLRRSYTRHATPPKRVAFYSQVWAVCIAHKRLLFFADFFYSFFFSKTPHMIAHAVLCIMHMNLHFALHNVHRAPVLSWFLYNNYWSDRSRAYIKYARFKQICLSIYKYTRAHTHTHTSSRTYNERNHFIFCLDTHK